MADLLSVVERDARPPMFSKGNVRYLPSAAGGLTSAYSCFDRSTSYCLSNCIFRQWRKAQE